MENEIINKVAQSPILTIDLKDFYPSESEFKIFDISDFLFEKLILKEKDYRVALKNLDYSQYQNKYVGITCSGDVIIPQWAYLLAEIHLFPYAKKIFFADKKSIIQKIILNKIENTDVEKYRDRPVVIKGCSDVDINIDAYIAITYKLMNVAKSIMYGEPCSNVPLFKKSILNK
jgi:hypothetical protein